MPTRISLTADMDPLTGIHVTAAGLLAMGGALKLARPAPAARALRSLHVPAGPATIRLVGLGEVAVAVAVVAFGGAVSFAAQALCYVGFVVVATAFWRRGELPSCGCFGEVESPPSVLHVVVTAVGALVSAHAALVGAPSPAHQPLAAAAGVLALAPVYLLLVDLPRLMAAVRFGRGATAL